MAYKIKYLFEVFTTYPNLITYHQINTALVKRSGHVCTQVGCIQSRKIYGFHLISIALSILLILSAVLQTYICFIARNNCGA